MNQPTLRPAVVPGRRRPAGLRAACLALLSWCVLPAALVHAAPIAPTTIGFDSISGAIGNYYNGGEGPNVGIESTFPAVGGWLDDQTNPTLNVPSGFTTGFAVVWNVRDGMRIRIFDDLDGAGTQLATQNFFGTSGTASLAFSGTAKSVRLERFGQPDFLGYDNLTFGSTTIGTPVSEPPAVTTSAATGVTSATATLNATINPAGTATTAQFEYGTTPSYGSTASVTLSPNDGTTAQTVSANLNGLAASTTYYYRATAVNGVGPRNGSELTFTTAAPPAKALHFDGANDFVNIDSARSQVSGASKLTIEMWVKPGALGGQPVLWSGSPENYIQTDTAHNLFLIFNGVGQVRWNKSSFFTPGVWQHVAMVFDGSLPDANRWRVYKDGALVTPTSAGGMPATIPSLSGQMLLGQYSGGGFNFPGAMDEVRIWNSARTQAEIQAFKDTEIASMPSCLIAYYKFNQGLANGANAGITTLTDIANATTENGTLNNFALTGATSNWTDGSGITETASAYAPGVPDINLKGGSPLVTILDGTTATGTASGTDFGSSLVGTGVPQTFTLENTGTSDLTVSALAFSGANPGDYAVSGITLPATVAANDSTTFTVTFTPSAGGTRTATVNVVNDDCDESNYDFALTGTGTLPPATALHFDGVNDSVDIPHQPGQLSYPFTVEAWVKTTDSHGLLVSKYVASSGNGWQMGTEGGKLTAWFFRPGGAGAIFPTGAGIVGATTINNDVWHHVAFVVDSTGGRLYVDGVSDGFSGWTSGTPGPATTTAPVRLGDVTTQTAYPFAGTLEEVRIWAVARSAADLQANKNSELAVMPPCLVGYYKFNQGVADASNAGVTSLVDATGGASGTLNNFALSGPTSNWTTGSGITAVTSVPDPTAPEINLTGNTLDIALADTTPRPEDDTDFGNAVVLGSPVVRTFTVQNTGPGASALNVSSIAVSGTHAANFTVGALTPAGPIAGGSTASFTVTFLPSVVGVRSATITVNNDDCNESAYSFAIQGTGVNTAPTVARDAATVTVPEGTTAFNSGTFADANSDTVTITASVGTITQSGAGTWTHQQTLTQGNTPIELTLDSQENLYVVNEGQNKLYKYDSSGSLVTSWTVTGNPTGVAVDSANGWLYVALKSGNRIDKFTLSGTLLTSWGSAGSANGQFNSPHCVAVDAAGDVYVADSSNNRIQVFSPAGAFLRTWGSTGSANGLFNFPQGLRISPGGTLYVADRNNNRVQYFDTAGTFLGKWGSAGTGNGQFNEPAGIGIDPGGNIVVGDIFNSRIQKFTATGTFMDKLGPSTTAGNLALPHGTAFPPSGRSVYIADYSNGRVVKFATPGGWNWSHTPADGAAGPTTVTITATDSFGAAGTTTFTLNVNNVAPTIALTGNATVPNGTPYTLNLGVITDPGTDTVSAFSINWGDGITENFTGNPASTTKTHTYATLGPKTITVTLTDEDGTFTGGTKSVTVENAAPVAAADGLNRPNTTTVAKVLKSVLLANDSDADGDPLTLTAVGNALPAGATVTLAGNFVVYTAPANNAGNGSFTYTLSAGAHSVTGTVTVTETSTSGGGGGTPNYLTLVPSGNDFVVTFLGVPGGSFRVQYSTAGPPNYLWQEFAPPAIHTAAPNGVFTHTDVNPPGPVRFYRAVSNP